MLYAPVEGWIAWIADEDVAVVWDGTTWSGLTTGGGSGSGSFTTLAINGATADTTNRLSLNAPATLLNHDGAGHQLKINKAAAGDTASLLYQAAFARRAEPASPATTISISRSAPTARAGRKRYGASAR